MKRRDLLKYLAGVSSAALAPGIFYFQKSVNSKKYNFTGSIVGANSKAGHLLRQGLNTVPSVEKKVNTLIVGGGISGLSAAWWLKKNNFNDFTLLEMDSDVGGNSASGKNNISAYPWGAHYIPLPDLDNHCLIDLFTELDIIKGFENGLPIYNEYYLCADPHERLYFQGQWQENLIPQHGIPEVDKKQYTDFFSYVEFLKSKKGSDHKNIFHIPLHLSSQDSEYLKLDQISMADFMVSKGWISVYLNWYVNYCCRDDYGMPHSQVSAWAGLHYFAARTGVGANADNQTVLTWPEGNGFLVHKLKEKLSEKINTKSLVYKIENFDSHVLVDVMNTADQSVVRYKADHVIYCGPRFTADKVIKNYKSPVHLDYAPWLVANISLKEKPIHKNSEMAWDNVSYYSPSLGYINASNQDLTFNHRECVITYYLPLDQKSVIEERKRAYSMTYENWLDIILPDLEKMHPDINNLITHIDLWVWGHGMVSPGINYLWSESRKEMDKPFGRVQFAHSDISGISIFEEALYHGVETAKNILRQVGHSGT